MHRKGHKAAVYAPPEPGLPYLAALIWEGEVIACDAVASEMEGQKLLVSTMPQWPQMVLDFQARKKRKDGEVSL